MKESCIVQLFTAPKKLACKLAEEKRIHLGTLLLVTVLVFIYRCFMLHKLDNWVFLRPIISIILFAMAQYFVYWLGKGKMKFMFIFNVSIYFHLTVVVGSFLKEIPVISILSFLFIQLLGIYYQYYIGINIVRAKERFVRIFCLLELGSALISVNYQLLTYLGRCVVYNQRTQFFGLIVK